MELRRQGGPEEPEPSKHKDINLFGFILYDQFDEDTADFMHKYGGTISSITGKHCWITIYENPELWGDYWKENAKEFYGEKYEEILNKWESRDSSYNNMSHKIADKLNISIDMFPCIIFLKSLDSYICTKPYPIINDKKFFRKLFSTVQVASKNRFITLEELDKEIDSALNTSWYIPEKIGERVELFNKYTDPFLNIAERFINIIRLAGPLV